MSAMEFNLTRIVQEALRLCREQDISQVDPYLIGYMACLQEVRAIFPNGASLLAEMDSQQVAMVAQLLAKLLSEKDSPTLAAIRMQINMEVVFKQQRQLVETEQAERDERIAMSARAVTSGSTGRDSSAASHDKLYNRVLDYVCLAGGMEAALTDEAAKEEVRAAMGSLFPLSSLARYLTLPEADRLAQIEELARITLGVCLYNKVLGRGGLALPPGAASYTPQAQRLLRDIQRHVAELTGEVAGCAALMRLATPQLMPGADVQDTAELTLQRGRAQAEAIHKAQTLVLYEGLADDLRSGLEAVAGLDAEMQHLLMQVTDTVGSSSAISKDKVYPMFDRLGAIHQALYDELRLLVVRQRLADELGSIEGGYVTLLQRMAKTRRPGRKTAVEEELARMEAAATAGVAQVARQRGPPACAEGASWVPPLPTVAQAPVTATTAAASDALSSALAAMGGYASLALNGFDPVLLVKLGQLRRCDLRLGCLKVEGEAAAYGFATQESMADFASAPGPAVAGVATVVALQPVLARLLNRAAAFQALDMQALLSMLGKPLKVDFGCQTPTHFVEQHIDHSYEWNAWALRRRALAMANLQNKRTHSTQTGLTHFKRDAEAQVWQPKEAQVQTRVNKGQSMPKKLQYVAGLRGTPDTKMKVIRLELDLGQPHQH